MSKKKPDKTESLTLSAEAISRFADEIADYADRLKTVVRTMQSLNFPSIERSSKRNQAILKALGQFTRGLEGALERMAEDIEESESTRLKAADTQPPYGSASKKNDTK